MLSLEVQRAIFKALTDSGALIAAVDAVVDELPEDYPADTYVTLGESHVLRADTLEDGAGGRGMNELFTVHVYARDLQTRRGFSAVKRIAGLVYAALHDATLVPDAGVFISCTWENTQFMFDPPFRRAVMDFTVNTEQA